jgi:hypothetical protein
MEGRALDDQAKMLTRKRIERDMPPYYAKARLNCFFVRVAEGFGTICLCPDDNERIRSIQRLTDFLVKAFAEGARHPYVSGSL